MIKIIKAAGSEHIDTIVNLAEKIWGEHYTPLIGERQVEYMLQNIHSRRNIKAEILSKEAIYYIAYYCDTPAGYCGIKIESNCIFLSKLYVDKSFRSKGLAKTMLRCVTDDYNSKSYIYLTVNKNNTDSIASYKKMGFAITKSVVKDIGNGFIMDDYEMKKEI